MANYLYQGDLPAGLDLGPVVAIDSETMGLQPARDRLCLVQLSGGDGDAHLRADRGRAECSASARRDARRPGGAEAVSLRPVRHRGPGPPLRGGVLAGLLHQDRLPAGPDLHRPARAEGPDARASRRRHLQAAAVERLGRGRALAGAGRLCRVGRPLPAPAEELRWTCGWRGRDGRRWRGPASTSCRTAPRSISPAGARSTSSRTAEGGRGGASRPGRRGAGDRHRAAGDRHRGGGARRAGRRPWARALSRRCR